MLLHNAKKRNNFYKAGLLVLASVVIGACGTDISYVSREEIKSNAFAEIKPRYLEKKPMSLGAIRLTSKDAKEGELGRVFLLQRSKGVYMAETMVKDTGTKRYFMSLGIDSRSKAPAFHFRMEF